MAGGLNVYFITLRYITLHNLTLIDELLGLLYGGWGTVDVARVDHHRAGVVDGVIAGHVIQHGMQQVGRCCGKNGDPAVNGLTCTDSR